MAEDDKSLEMGDEQLDEKSTTATTDNKAEKNEAKMYPESYVKRIHNENAARRKREEELEKRLKEFEDKELAAETDKDKKIEALEKRNKQIEKEYGEKQTAADRRFILSEAKRLAREKGIIDPDDVRSMNLSDLRVDDDDNVAGLEEKIDALMKSKPHWFKSEDKKEAKTEERKRTVTTPERKDGTTTSTDYSKLDAKQFSQELSQKFGVSI